ncbi:MAG: DUF4900 domain-containing protein [Candidatus Omnitrophota bacterium]|jgi:hypothetical protein
MKNLSSKKGVALIAVYLALVVLLIFLVVFFNVSTSQNLSANLFIRRAQAFDLAEAGLDQTIYCLRAQILVPAGDQYLGAGKYNITVQDLGAPGGVAFIHRYKITSVGTVGSVSRTLENNVQTDNYARYIWFTDSEYFQGNNVWFWSQDTLNGPVHTNGHFNIYGTPTFQDLVESVDSYITYYNNGNNINLYQLSNPPYDIPNFSGGANLGTNSINMPTQDLSLRSASTATGGLRLNGDSTVVLNSDGTMNITNSSYCISYNNSGQCTQNCSGTCTNQPLPANGALFVNNGNLTVSGTLKGRLSVGASGNITIPNSIVYANDPRVSGSTSTDTLGIVAEQDVVIPSSAPFNLEIDASIMALNTSFYLQNWASGSPKGTLTVFGGIIQKQRGPVGTFNGSTGTKISGYSKSYSYDKRLLDNPPPFVPTTGDYVTLSWEDANI